ncbi:MAG: hypothetical protein ACLF0G_12725 [Candidatus Brocadiia bacterium]
MPSARTARLVLETSLKPFRSAEPQAVRRTCHRLLGNWERLIAHAEELCILLWVGDGSEILEWRGDWEQPIVWAQWIGFCNLDVPGVYPPQNPHYAANKAQPTTEEPPTIRFRDLRAIIHQLRAAARERLGREILVGATVDPGPEFVHSRFKYHEHREVLVPGVRERMPSMVEFLTHQAALHADSRPYAAFPEGIAEGTPFGTFLGKQFAAAATALGFDYLWLSNGLGYSHFPWGWRGEVFDGSHFDPVQAGIERDKTNQFWLDFRAECPDLPVEVRGTNYSVGMDLATDGCSHADIAAEGGLQRPPCNPPWGSRALGLEMTAYLSRLASPPGRALPFRFYLNDPWFTANPWFDYYHRETYDIAVPMSAARLATDGSVQPPTDLALLTIDTERGELPRQEADEVVPQLLRALELRADAPGPLVWLYPFAEYHQVLDQAPERLGKVFFNDWFACEAVDAGLPLNTVCSDETFVALAQAGRLPPAVTLAPLPAGRGDYMDPLLDHVRAGGRALLYGPLDRAEPELLAALGLRLAPEPLEGDFQADVRLAGDRFGREPRPPAGPDALDAAVGVVEGPSGAPAPGARPLRHRAVVGGGGLRAVADWDDPGLRVVVSQGGQRRAYAVCRAPSEWRGGRLAWLRGTVSIDPSAESLGPTFDEPWQVLRAAEWARPLLGELGLEIVQDRRDAATRAANVFVKRHRGAWCFVGHKPDTTVRFWTRTEDGAPLFAESETPIVDGRAGQCFPKSFASEVRAFARMTDGVVRTKEMPPPVGRARRVAYSGLVNADLVLYPPPGALASGQFELHATPTGDAPVAFEATEEGHRAVVRGFTGTLYATW